MRYHIDTIPVWDAAKLDGECLLCALHRKTELGEAERYLGASVMEPDVRIQVNARGFCQKHHAMLFGMSNRLGHALMLESHNAETSTAVAKHLEAAKKAAADLAAAPLGKLSRAGNAASKRLEQEISALQTMTESCLMCDSIAENMRRYLHTFFHLWQNDREFRQRVTEGKGFCLPHCAELLRVGREELGAREYSEFVQVMDRLERESLERLQGDISWFIKKFDYRFASEPWKNSRDAVPRAVNKLRGWCVGDEPNPKE